jgi:cysteine-rich repeat protein
MVSKYWFALGLCGSGLTFVACSPAFTDCETTRSCPVGGSGGAGTGNANGGGSGGIAGDSGDAAGSGAEGGAPEVTPALFGTCSAKGAVACDAHASARRLACDGEMWQAGTTCGAEELCDATDGNCAPIVPECAEASPGEVVCREDTLLTCGPDLVTASVGKTCEGRCTGGVCKAPTCGDQKVEEGEDCDDEAEEESGACLDCQAARCGDNAVYAAEEQCDDGNELSGDGCSASCQVEPVAIALGGSTTCVLSATGVVKCWGSNESGVLGLGDGESRGGVQSQVPSKLPAIDLGSDRKATAITVSGGNSACALLDNGDVKCWGNGESGQLGTGDSEDRGDEPGEMGDALKAIPLGVGRKAIAISAGDDHTCAVLDAGTVKCWGSGADGELGLETADDVYFPEQSSAINLKRPARSVSAGTGVSCAVLDDGTLKCWGATGSLPLETSADLDDSGGVGDYTGEISALPALKFNDGKARAAVASVVSEALLDNGSLVLWGFGFGGWTNAVVVPSQLASLPAMQMGPQLDQPGRKVTSSDVDDYHACAVLADGELKCWGYAPNGALGLGTVVSSGTKQPRELASVALGAKAVQVAVGQQHSCAILEDGTLKCWGYNDAGQLGLGDFANRGNSGDQLSADTTVDLTF